MSLESAVTTLTTSVNALTREVTGKMQQIDVKVDQSTRIVESTIKSKMYRSFYVDQLNGKADNDGSKSNPFGSLFDVWNYLIPGGHFRVILLSDYRFDPKLEEGKDTISVPACTLEIIGQSAEIKLTFVAHVRPINWEPDSPHKKISSRFDFSKGGAFSFTNLLFDYEDIESDKPIHARYVVFATNQSASPSSILDMRFFDCDFVKLLSKLPESGFMLEKTNNLASIVHSNCVFPAEDALQKKAVRDARVSDNIGGSIYTNFILRD